MSNEMSRNAPCPCGSGKKYKNCCITKKTSLTKPRRPLWVTVLILLAVFAAGAGVMKVVQSPQQTTQVAPLPAPLTSPLTGSSVMHPQPPGPVPPGKVWSPEHGHWHNIVDEANTVAGSAPITIQPNAEGTLTPQPDGPVPEGKEWSAEHGHWHNKVGSTEPVTITIPAETDAEASVDTTDEEDLPTEFTEVVSEDEEITVEE